MKASQEGLNRRISLPSAYGDLRAHHNPTEPPWRHPVFVRVRDPQTRHEFDVDESSHLLRKGLVERVKPKQYPPARFQRRPKYYRDLAGRPATQETPPPSGEGEATQTDQE